MIFRLACGDVLPGCPAHFETTRHEALLAEVAEHARTAHQIGEITPDVLAEVEDAIERVDAEGGFAGGVRPGRSR